ncbi:hypothetical protein [Microvirga mediterraneensis]|uniref:Uncharacterized protein n=1 Tax=Microvirga mediterraneensis TaxID=2754695 RepID=A0A838BWA9_9HYPH|nr:hypothetical protein [Microvirga mediterraneensis]MBA1159359.1 hypothetical protein [Microvirga mediterraneensis]
MDDIIDLNAERNKREQPDPEFSLKDDYGRPMFIFGIEYSMDGKQWSTRIIAYSWEDAEARLAAIKESGRVYGQIMGEVPA